MTEDEMWLFTSQADEDDVQAVVDVLERGTWWANGSEISQFEERVSTVCNTEFGIAYNSGSSALYSALLALDVEGEEVIVPSFTYPATVNAVVAAGGKPVFADIERSSFGLSAGEVRDKITDETGAIVVVHFSGNVCRDIHALQEIASEHDAALVEDAAHSLGATFGDEPVGSFGTAAAFSFAFNKLVATGEGGMLVTDSETLERRVRRIRFQGRNERSEYVEYGYNLQMSSITAALGVSRLRKLDRIISKRHDMATYLNDRLSSIDGLRVPAVDTEWDRVFLYYNVYFDETKAREGLRSYLAERNVPTRITYEPVHLTAYYQAEWGSSEGDLPVTEDVSKHILSLPFHLELDEGDLEYISESVCEYFADNQ